ncbi:biotin/lipoyl-containing protein [Clostridiisalibacter paucivorans]|uniref:biotin/lipoyl-containing protein n=1 Tax=Clostridiisalibacter paucivorans TaxID=408753 RepID=UPI00047B4FBB|nr:biotin/lipoyl-containing protein [Clostridiisalibacter paucivorans]
MDKYRIHLNGEVYEIEVEKVESSEPEVKTPRPVKPVKSIEPVKPVKKVESNNVDTPGNGEPVVAPMPGLITDIKVTEGERVMKGQVLIILEAMKMENEIIASKDGVVSSINISKGAQVEAQEVLITLA